MIAMLNCKEDVGSSDANHLISCLPEGTMPSKDHSDGHHHSSEEGAAKEANGEGAK